MNGQPARPNNAIEQELSPLWRGCRLSVIIPTYNRKEKLLRCLDALQQQSILCQEFEVLVVDDGSTDGTESALKSAAFPFPIRFLRQDHQGPGAARNLGIAQSQGELVLFIGDDIIADERLLENHLLAHAHFPEETIAVLGYITWPAWMKPNPVMEYVTGESGLQFGYPLVEKATSLDHRFFYTSNISLKRLFVLGAAQAGVRFDPAFRYAAYEDVDYAYRLKARGLRIEYCKEAIAYHDHWMDRESFMRRQYLAGQMSVVFYRKHPGWVGPQAVQWLTDWVGAVEGLMDQPALLETIRSLETDLEQSLTSSASALETLLSSELPRQYGDVSPELQRQSLSGRLERILGALFGLATARGQVEEWYANVTDASKVEAAKSLAVCFKVLDLFNSDPGEIFALKAELDEEERIAQALQHRTEALEKQKHALQDQLHALQEQQHALQGLLHALQEELDQIKSSRMWALATRWRRIRLFLTRLGNRHAPASESAPTDREQLSPVQQRQQQSGDLALVSYSRLFDEGWYLSHYSDVAASGIGAAEHYLSSGGLEGRDPGPQFSSERYLTMYPDVRQAGINPLVHYLKSGLLEGRIAYPSALAQTDGVQPNEQVTSREKQR